jgi:hypothetical protein
LVRRSASHRACARSSFGRGGVLRYPVSMTSRLSATPC